MSCARGSASTSRRSDGALREVPRSVHSRGCRNDAAGWRSLGHQRRQTLEGAASIAKVGVAHHWIVDTAERTVAAYRLDAGRWLELGVYSDDHEARIEPFDAVPLDVASWWI